MTIVSQPPAVPSTDYDPKEKFDDKRLVTIQCTHAELGLITEMYLRGIMLIPSNPDYQRIKMFCMVVLMAGGSQQNINASMKIMTDKGYPEEYLTFLRLALQDRLACINEAT